MSDVVKIPAISRGAGPISKSRISAENTPLSPTNPPARGDLQIGRVIPFPTPRAHLTRLDARLADLESELSLARSRRDAEGRGAR